MWRTKSSWLATYLSSCHITSFQPFHSTKTPPSLKSPILSTLNLRTLALILTILDPLMSQLEFSSLVCDCGTRVLIRTSWTDENPGRRFKVCQKYKRGGCSFWEWEDPPMCRRAKAIIPGLLRKINAKDAEIEKLKKIQKSWKKMLGLMIAVCVFFIWKFVM